MKKLVIWIIAALMTTPVLAQKDSQAREVLDKAVAAVEQAGGIRATFSGTASGTLLMKGDRFYLEGGGIQSWFDGKTQWSYIESGDEVNISSPTPEELLTVSPHALLNLYKQGFNYSYGGRCTRQGKRGYEVTLTPEQRQDIRSITLFVSEAYLPLYIKVEQNGQSTSELKVTSIQTHQPLDDATFRFDKRKYPDAEVIDLR